MFLKRACCKMNGFALFDFCAEVIPSSCNFNFGGSSGILVGDSNGRGNSEFCVGDFALGAALNFGI